VGGGARDRVEQLLHRRANALLGGPAARWRPDGLGAAGEIEEVGALGRRRAEAREPGAEDAVGGASEVAAFEAGVVRNADTGEDGDFLPSQARDAAGVVIGQADVGGLEPGPPGGQELAVSLLVSIASAA
jgi:hypothetical protein